MVTIIPLSTATIDLKRLATIAKQTLDININAEDTIKGHIKALQDVFGNDSTPLRHVYQSFIVVANKDVLYNFIIQTSLEFNIIETWKSGIMFVVMSSNLHRWKYAVHDCSGDDDYEIRNIATQLLSCFDKMGLSFIFSDLKRLRQKDGTLLLEK
jgi:hypothetical protein